MAPWVRQSQSRGRKERKSIFEATAELTAACDRGNVPDIGTVDWEVETENMEGRAHSRTCKAHNKRSVDTPLSFYQQQDLQEDSDWRLFYLMIWVEWGMPAATGEKSGDEVRIVPFSHSTGAWKAVS